MSELSSNQPAGPVEGLLSAAELGPTQPVSPAESLPASEPYTGQAPVISGGKSGSPLGRFGKKKLMVIVGSAVAVLLLAGAAVYGLYLPTTPNSVWNTSISRSGKALDTLVQSATQESKLKAYSTSAIKGSIDAHMGGGTYSGTFTTTFDKASLDGGLDVTLKDSGTSKTISTKVLSQIPVGGVYPDVYVQVTGLKALGLDALLPGISAYDAKWIVISSDYLKSLGSSIVPTTDNTATQVTASDIAQIARTASTVTKDYVFSTAPDKAVFVRKSFVGKETVDGIKAYHYKVGVNNTNARAYCIALSNAVLATDAYKKITGSTAKEIADQKKSQAKSCKDASNDVKSTDSFDLWVDSHYKLIYKVRVYDQSNKQIYTDIGQLYKGGDQLSLFATFHDGSAKSDGKLTVNTSLSTNITKATFTMKQTGDNPYDVTATLDAGVSNKPVQITKPTGAIPIKDVLDKFGLGDVFSGSPASIAPGEDDLQRTSDINSLDLHLEAYFANSGYYPTLAQINTASWRATNLKGADSEVFKDPSGTSTQLAAKASATQYGYAPAGCNATGCQSFTVSALLSDGTTYSKASS